MKNSQEMVRASLLPLFNNIAEDLNQTVQNLEQRRYSHIKGTLQRGTTSLAYVHMVLLPVLASMLDHLGKNNYGADVFGKILYLYNKKPPRTVDSLLSVTKYFLNYFIFDFTDGFLFIRK